LADFKGKKIAFVSTIDTSFIILFYNQLTNLRKQGFELSAISTLEFPENIEFFKKIGVEFIEVPIKRKISPFADLLTVARLYRVFKRKQFDLIHTQLPKTTLLGAIAAKLARIPVVNTARPIFREMPPSPGRRFFILMEKIAAALTDLVMVENPLDYELYLSLDIVKEKKLFIQGNGVDLSRFDPGKISAQERDRLRAELGIPKSAKVIGSSGRYVYEKGFAELFAAFKELSKKYPELFLLTAGFYFPSEAGTIPKDLPRQMGIADRTLMLENRKDMEKIFSLMDIFVFPTHRDCFPRSLIEAAAMEKPIVASDLKGCQVVVENEKTGLLVPPKDSKLLAGAIERLLKDPSFAQNLGQSARRFALQNLDEQKVCERIVACYQRVLESAK